MNDIEKLAADPVATRAILFEAMEMAMCYSGQCSTAQREAVLRAVLPFRSTLPKRWGPEGLSQDDCSVAFNVDTLCHVPNLVSRAQQTDVGAHLEEAYRLLTDQGPDQSLTSEQPQNECALMALAGRVYDASFEPPPDLARRWQAHGHLLAARYLLLDFVAGEIHAGDNIGTLAVQEEPIVEFDDED